MIAVRLGSTVLVVALRAAGCRDVPIDDVGWACGQGSECGSGQVCHDGLCRDPATLPLAACSLTLADGVVHFALRRGDAPALELAFGDSTAAFLLPVGFELPDDPSAGLAACCLPRCCEGSPR